jgi:hypothetical protein
MGLIVRARQAGKPTVALPGRDTTAYGQEDQAMQQRDMVHRGTGMPAALVTTLKYKDPTAFAQLIAQHGAMLYRNARIVHVPLFGLDLVLESMGRFLLGNWLSSLAGCPGDVFFS